MNKNTDLIITSPAFLHLFTPGQINRLKRAAHLTVYTQPQPFSQLPALRSLQPKILAIDPDFCNWQIPDSVITKTPKLQAICLQTTSHSWLDTRLAARHHISVTNLVDWSTPAVAEWALLSAISLARQLPVNLKNRWQTATQISGIELEGQTVGIIGLGRIGTRIAELCHGLYMPVSYWSPHARDVRFQYQSLRRLLKTSDLIFPAFAHSLATTKLLSSSRLSLLKPTAILVNITHQLPQHRFLLEMVKTGRLFGYGYETEDGSHLMTQAGNVWDGPAAGWLTQGSKTRNAEQWLTAMLHAVNHHYPTQVN